MKKLFTILLTICAFTLLGQGAPTPYELVQERKASGEDFPEYVWSLFLLQIKTEPLQASFKSFVFVQAGIDGPMPACLFTSEVLSACG